MNIPPVGNTLKQLQQNPPLDPLENRLLLGHILGLTRIELITQSERCINADEAKRLGAVFQRRINGEPIAYIVGYREFYGLSFNVTSDVLIPRPETEHLVELALERLPKNGRILDMGTGSGAIAIAIAHTRPDAQVTAIDVSNAALTIARKNALQHGVDVNFLQSDWYVTLPGQRFDLIVANPPYIVENDMHLAQGDLRFEPIDALTDHADGLSALRRIIFNANEYLNLGGWLLMEHGYDQAGAVAAMLAEKCFSKVQSWRDLAEIERVTGGVCATSSVESANRTC